jgi:O-antigen/teichoic acid export membrane protein
VNRSDEPTAPPNSVARSPVGGLVPAAVELPISDPEPLRAPDIGVRVVRGGAVRSLGYGAGMLLTAGASALLLRHLGVADFGRYMTVASLIAVVGGVTDAGLTAVGGRDLALRPMREDRDRLLANLLGLRLVATPIGVGLAILFAFAAGYDGTLVIGTVLAGIGLIVVSAQATMTLPLSVELRIGSLTTIELLKQVLLFVGIATLVASGAGLLPFLALFIAVGMIITLLTPAFLGRRLVWRPRRDRDEWRILIREALPLAGSVVMGVLYFRLLIVITSLIASAVATGLFATSFRVVEILYGVSALITTTALPVLAAAADDRERLGYMLQRMIEVALIAACLLVVLIVVLAQPVLDLLGGSQYRQAAPVLRIQVLALIPVFLAHACQIGLISIRRQRALASASAFALVLVVCLGAVLVPLYGAKGAAFAAVGSECAFAAVLLLLVIRADPALAPTFSFLWKPLAALGSAAAVATLAHLSAPSAAIAAGFTFVGVIIATRALPPEVWDAARLRPKHQTGRRNRNRPHA